jgi:thiol-disulfide isomerase/thioredoxin
MKTIRAVSILAFAFIAVLDVKSQSNNNVIKQLHTLKIGDTLPDIPLKKIINHKTASARSSDFLNKFLIIDFWGIHCAPCISAMPHLQEIQNRYGDQLDILLSTTDKEADVRKLLNTSPIAKSTKLSVSVEDTLLDRLFPHMLIPHEIWIDRKGVVRYITSEKEITDQNVAAFVNNQNLFFGEKKDFLDWDYTKYNAGIPIDDSTIVFRSMLTRYKAGIPASSFIDKDSNNNIKRAYFSSTQLIRILFKAVTKNNIAMLNRNYLDIQLKDSAIINTYVPAHLENFIPESYPFYKWNSKQEWLTDNIYNYELITSIPIPDSIFFGRIIDDINAIVPFKTKIVTKTDADCWIVKASDSAKI